MANRCRKRDKDTGEMCESRDATYGVTIKSHIAETTYSIMVCKRHFDAYLSDPAGFIASHEVGGLRFLMQEVENVEPIRRSN